MLHLLVIWAFIGTYLLLMVSLQPPTQRLREVPLRALVAIIITWPIMVAVHYTFTEVDHQPKLLRGNDL